MPSSSSSIIISSLDRQWLSACKTIFGREIEGDLSLYREWLLELSPPLSRAPSSITGEAVTYAITDYCKGSKRASFDEVWKLSESQKFAPLTINEIKDMDSLLSSIRERAYYAGSVVLGNSSNIEASSNCTDSHFVLDCGMASGTKYAAYSGRVKQSEAVFGCDAIGECQFLVRGFEAYRLVRCFEAWKTQNSSDCMYVNGLANSSGCLFCFNARNLRHAIGNLELPKEKYAKIREKLAGEMAEMLEREKRLPSLVDIVAGCKEKPAFGKVEREKEEKNDLGKVEDAFRQASRLVFGKELANIDSYGDWLKRHVVWMGSGKSIISGKGMLMADYGHYADYPKSRLVTLFEAEELGKRLKLSEEEAEKLEFRYISRGISKIAFLSPEYFMGQNVNVSECSTQYESMNAYRAPGTSFTKNTAYSFWPRNADHVFGSSMAFSCQYCINCYYSENLNRCFECDSCKSCSDSYYLHNCENVRSSMFCFNAKNLTYAIGNVEVGKEAFEKAKKMLLEWMNGQLERKKEVSLSIFDVGCQKN